MNAKKLFPILALGLSVFHGLPAWALTLSQSPMFIASTEPRILLVASRDHQLSVKAYTDYSDLNGDGTLDTTYNDAIAYYGYFDSDKCYAYQNNRFEPSAAVTVNTHQCDGTKWSGNFLNWAAMTRMDILRKTFYGGYRSTDDAGAGAVTVLERHFLPDDVHAFVKVFNPGKSADITPYVPSAVVGANTAISLCNVSDSNSASLTGKAAFVMPAPYIKVAAGVWPQWDSSEVTQCAVNSGKSTQPNAVIGTYTARVQVCVAGMLEENCKRYSNMANPAVVTVKPIGLLQTYGDVDADRRVRFGLMTGSYGKNKSGGVLRKNVGFIANNNKATVSTGMNCGTGAAANTPNGHANDEINVCTGQFINQASNQAGIINTLNRLRIAGFQYSTDKHQYSCNTYGILNFNNGECVDWGNPLGETYLEALKYFAGLAPTAAYDAFSGTTDTSILESIPAVPWADPLPATEWCALSNIVVLSTGLNSFDTDQLASFTPTGGGTAIDAATLTQTVGDANHEAINGGTYLIGNVTGGAGNNNQCTAKALGNLANAKGLCPEVPSTEGGYGIAGLAYGPKTIDLRPNYEDQRDNRWGGATPINEDWALRQPLNTYAVQLSESLPSFSVPVGANGNITLLPACMAYDGSPGAWPADPVENPDKHWRNCSMTNLIVDTNVAMADVGTVATAREKTCSGNGTTSQCFTVAWEDSTWGNDYDMDGIQRLGYCVGAACQSFKMLCPTSASATATLGPWAAVGAGQMVIATCAAQANAGNSLTFGYTVTGSTADGVSFPIYRPGGKNFNVGQVKHADVTNPNAVTFTQGVSAAGLLKNPLWYAAKYGGFTESTPGVGTPKPDVAAEWDAIINEGVNAGQAGSDGIPDSYFDVKNPANLETAMASIFDAASQPDASAASVATNSTNLKIESRVYQAKFSSADWSGQLLSYKIDTNGQLEAVAEWDAGSLINGQNHLNGREILTKDAADGVAFAYANLTAGQKALLDQVTVGANVLVDGCGLERVAYLRGDDTHEGASGSFNCAAGVANPVAKFRERANSKLGDIVNSNPWYVGKPSAGYSNVDHPGYSAFRAANLGRTAMVYVAGNDGMLHGFDASLDFQADPEGLPTADSGKEKLAYIPTPVYANLSSLTHSTYNKNHKYYVDGSPMIGDADLDSGAANNWRSVLVGALGGGGKGYYALDVTNPANFDEANAASLLLWEFTAGDDVDMGYVFNHPPAHFSTGQPKQLVKMANGKWAVVLGNGYNSTNGTAVLYIVFIEEGVDGVWTAGTDYIKIVADNAGSNGLSTPVPFDMDGNGVVDVVYAGDLKGNLWKFLVGDANPANWRVDFSLAGCAPNCNPLFQAANTQAIIWPPEVSVHPSQPGALVLFGTGKYLEGSDVSNTDVQAYYGVWDKNDGVTTVAVADLVQRHISTDTVNDVNGDPVTVRISCDAANRTIANCQKPPVDWTADMGWYVNLPTNGERATGITKLLNGVLYVNTFIPSASPCDSGGSGWLMALDYATGEDPAFAVFDVDNSGTIDAADALISGMQVGAALGGTTLIQGADVDSLGVGVSSLTSGVMRTNLINFGAGARGRVSWREIVQ